MRQPEELENYTKDHAHHGVNCPTLLGNFRNYMQGCSDPENILRFMEEKAICTFMPEFWMLKADHLADVGDYTAAFECVEQAYLRNGIEYQKEEYCDVGKKENEVYQKMVEDMKTFPIKSKRSVEEFSLFSKQLPLTDIETFPQKYEKILKIYESKYGGLRRQKQDSFRAKRAKLQPSWLASVYESEEIIQRKIEDRIHQNSMRLSREVKYHSMHTPLKSRNPHRLTKTMDSVQILRKKRSTNEKSRRMKNLVGNTFDSDSEDLREQLGDGSMNKIISSVPVGKTFSKLKRRVTFDMFKELQRSNKLQGIIQPVEASSGSESITRSDKPQDQITSSGIEEASVGFKSLQNHPQQ